MYNQRRLKTFLRNLKKNINILIYLQKYHIRRNLRPYAETHVKQFMSRMFSLEVAQQFNMAGTDGKKSFSALKIYQIFHGM